jgi:hypothetical protein
MKADWVISWASCGETQLAQRGGIDQAEMPPDDFSEGVFGVLPGVAGEQFQVRVAHVGKHIGADSPNSPKNLKEM